MSLTAPPHPLAARFLVCEDGSEYVDRFNRFLAPRFTFTRVGDFGELCEYLGRQSAREERSAGLLLDLDFRRTPSAKLVDELGQPAVIVSDDDHRRIASLQGIAILSALRRQGSRLPAILFADLDDAAQCAYLRSALRPLDILASSIGLNALVVHLEALSQARDAAR